MPVNVQECIANKRAEKNCTGTHTGNYKTGAISMPEDISAMASL
jgi:hypothetical protein